MATLRRTFAERIERQWPLSADLPLDAILRQFGVQGISMSLLAARRDALPAVFDYVAGKARPTGEALQSSTLVQIASISKTFAAAFALDLFAKHELTLETPVNQVLEKFGSEFRVKAAAGKPQEWSVGRSVFS